MTATKASNSNSYSTPQVGLETLAADDAQASAIGLPTGIASPRVLYLKIPPPGDKVSLRHGDKCPTAV